MADECPLSEQEQEWLDAGIAEFNSGRYWHAHEDWEEMWKSLKARGAGRKFIRGIQGLIQIAALMFQYEKCKSRGTINMWHKLTDKLGTPESPMFQILWALNIPEVLEEVSQFYADASSEDPTWDLDPHTVLLRPQ